MSYVVGLVSQFMQMPRKPHLDAVRCILRYVKSTLHYGLFYEAGKEIQVFGYTDVDWVDSMYDRRSTMNSCYPLAVQQLHGVAKSNRQLLYLVHRLSTEVLLWQHVRWYGCKSYCMIWMCR